MFLTVLTLSSNALAEKQALPYDRCEDPNPPKLQSHEPNIIGITSDSNDVPFLDLKMSLKYPLFHRGMYCGDKTWHGWPFPYMAGTVRFAQYSSDDRHSSPVIGKRFNPNVFGRYWFDAGEKERKKKKGKFDHERTAYIDIGFAHESNGQKVDTEAEYLALKASNPNNPEFANDFLSRGWDYYFVSPKYYWVFGGDTLSVFGNFKYFPNRSAPQGKNEEYNVWEGARGGENFKRRGVDGITGSFTYKQKCVDLLWGLSVFCKNKAIYTTGYDRPFRYSTVRIEIVSEFWELPFMTWWSNGYNSDLTDYFRRVNSFGGAFELTTFD